MFYTNEEMIDISRAKQNNSILVFDAIPELPFLIKTMQIPDMTIGTTQVPLPKQIDWQIPSVKHDITPVTLLYFADEHYFNYFALLEWYKKCREANSPLLEMRDATLLIMNNAKQPILRFNLKDSWPNSMGTLEFDNQATELQAPYVTLYTSELYWEFLIEVPKGVSKTGCI